MTTAGRLPFLATRAYWGGTPGLRLEQRGQQGRLFGSYRRGPEAPVCRTSCIIALGPPMTSPHPCRPTPRRPPLTHPPSRLFASPPRALPTPSITSSLLLAALSTPFRPMAPSFPFFFRRMSTTISFLYGDPSSIIHEQVMWALFVVYRTNPITNADFVLRPVPCAFRAIV